MSVTVRSEPVPRFATGRWRGALGTFLRGSRTGLFVLALVVGLGAGLGAIVFRELVDGITWLTTGHREFGQAGHAASDHLRWLGLSFYVLIPAVGGILYGPLVYRFAREARGHGVPEVMVAVADKGGRIRPQVAVVKALASALTIGSGGSVGREGPIVQIGSAMASTLGQWVRTPDSRLRILVACGAGGGIAATFNAPITGVFFAVEIILRELAGEALFAVMLSAMVADAVAIPVLGNHAFLEQFPVHAALHHSTTYLLIAVLAVVAAVVGQLFRVVLYAIEDLCDLLWRGKPEWARPIAGGLVVGLVLLAVPQLFGVGYPVMFKALDGGYAAWFLLVLLLGKIVATSLTLGFGGSGGVFAPSLFVGLMTGMLYGVGVQHLFGASAGSPALYAAVGMAGVFGSSTRAPLTALASVVEMTGDYSLTLPVMLTVGIATVVARSVSYGTIYTTKLLRRGQDIERAAPWRAFAGLSAQDVMQVSRLPADVPQERPTVTLGNAVIDRRRPHAVFASESATEVLRHLQTEGRDAVPVISESGHHVVGWATERSVLRTIASRLAVRAVPPAGEDPEPGRDTLPGHHVLEIEAAPEHVGSPLSAIAWPHGFVPISLIRHGRHHEARPEAVLRDGDVVGLLVRD
jgi:CIC family chloride channel protein